MDLVLKHLRLYCTLSYAGEVTYVTSPLKRVFKQALRLLTLDRILFILNVLAKAANADSPGS